MCSISRDPRCEECTICTARAPDAVFTVRTYGDTGQLYDQVSAHPQPRPATSPQVTDLQDQQVPAREPSQVSHHQDGRFEPSRKRAFAEIPTGRV